ncbi:MAG: SPFH domain-containing protein [Planctomycetota bacterium]
MGLFDKLRGEFVDIIEWIDDNRQTLVWRFPRYQNEIKNGAQLIVRPGQVAVFVHRGQLADLFEPGNYSLTTDNLPLLSTIMGWKFGFNSPFRSEVYFVSTRQITDLKWGTPNPIMYRDADFGPIRLRAFGTYSLKAIDAKILLKELVGTDGVVEADEITELLRSLIATAFAEMLGKAKIAALDISSSYQQLSDSLRGLVGERIDDEYGLSVPQLSIVNVSLPEEVEKALDTRSSMGVLGDMGRYQQFQFANSLPLAAGNPSGGAAASGLGLGMGFAMAGQMANAVSQASVPPTAAPVAAPVGSAPPPLPTVQWHVAVNGVTQGPFSVQQLAQGVASREITAASLVWANGQAGWLPVSQVPALSGLFAAVPPPPPPPAP